MTTESADPWGGIAGPDRTESVNAQRVSGASRWGLFWGVDAEQACLLMLRFQRGAQVSQELPRLRGLTVERRSPAADAEDVLIIRLLESEQREIFYRLCLDIVDATNGAATEAEALSRFVARTWRWHRLLRGGRDGRLNEEQQRGLVGELGLLERYLLSALGAAPAVRSWRGPLGAPKDFEIGRVCVEVKARRGDSAPQVTISSEHQLDSTGVDVLVLYVVEVVEAVGGTENAATVTEMANRIRAMVAARDPMAADLFDGRLFATGFDWADDYSDRRWVRGREHFFNVRDEFPRITRSGLPSGIVNVRYSVFLAECEVFRMNPEDLLDLVRSR